jgi:SAM-dependent methyltransferase
MRPDDVAALKDDLLNYHADLESPELRTELVEYAWPRLLATLDMIPDRFRTGDVLELGATPFFLTLCLRRLCTGRIALGNYFGTREAQGVQRLRHRRTGEELRLAFDLFNVETDDFPYADASFDVVIFSELIEHLGLNPVRTLSEIHRVLRPDGIVVVTTPNALSLERLEAYLYGTRPMVDRYSPLFGYGARHNREYHPRELRTLLEGCGFVIEDMQVRDLAVCAGTERWRRALWRRVLARFSSDPRDEHIFLRARRQEPFRWAFPPSLFDNIEFFTLVRYPWMEMGINDAIQCADGWHPVEERRGAAGAQRWTRGPLGQGFLKTPAGRLTFHLECRAAPTAGAPPLSVRVIVWDRWLGRVKRENVYVDTVIAIERGPWRQFALPVEHKSLQAGDEVEVRLELDPDQLAAPALAPLPEREHGLAVHRFWFAAAEAASVHADMPEAAAHD